MAVWLLLAVLGQLSLRALVGGAALVLAPTGRIIGLSTVPLDGTPFGDFLVPGLVLLTVFGLGSAVLCYGLYAGYRWSWLWSIGMGIAMLGWLFVELAVGFNRPTIYLNLGTAGAILLLAFHPSIRRVDRDSGRIV